MNEKIYNEINDFLNNEITNETLVYLFYKIGKLINNYNNRQLIDLELFLKSRYGIVIAFTKRNLINMINFSLKDDVNNYIDIPWKYIIKNKYIKDNNDDTLKELINLKNTFLNK